MEDESTESQSRYPLARPTARLSKTPSWVMLGFLLGALFVYALMRHNQVPPPAVTVQMLPPAPAPAKKVETPRLTTIEAVFAVWGEHAVWWADTTEVALWNSQERAFSDCYEVRRLGDALYFRSIPSLTRRVIRRGKELPDSPLQFTETEQQYREWLEHGRKERPAEPTLVPVTPTHGPNWSGNVTTKRK